MLTGEMDASAVTAHASESDSALRSEADVYRSTRRVRNAGTVMRFRATFHDVNDTRTQDGPAYFTRLYACIAEDVYQVHLKGWRRVGWDGEKASRSLKKMTQPRRANFKT